MNEPPRTPQGDRIVVIRPSRGPRGLLVPIAIVIVAGLGFAARTSVSDWRGLSQEAQRGWNRLFATQSPTKKKTEPVALAQNEAKPPEAQAKPADTKKPDDAVAAAPVPRDNPAWDDIQRAAEKAHAEQEEAKRIKEEADRKLAETPPPPPRRMPRMRRLDPADLAAMMRQQEAMMREMDAFMFGGRNDFEAMMRQQREAQQRFLDKFANNRNRQGFGNLPPGFERFAQPLPGMDRMNAPWPGQPQIQERSGEEERDGVKTRWKTRVIIVGPNGFTAS